MFGIVYLTAILSCLISSLAASLKSKQCQTNGECLRRGLPLKKPRSVPARSISVNKRDQPNTFGVTNGLQYWVVPPGDGLWSITANGAAGGSAGATTLVAGGNGISITSLFQLVPGTNYTVVVGAKGLSGEKGSAAGGGGASWVYLTSDTSSPPLIVAASGGGSGISATFGVIGLPGNPGQGIVLNDPGQGGAANGASGGAGWYSPGQEETVGSTSQGGGGKNRQSSPPFGQASPVSFNPSSGLGAFGGGGSANTFNGGGGAGYSGGNGGNVYSQSAGAPGTGGTSYAYVAMEPPSGSTNYAATVTGDGSVTFTKST